MDRSCRIGEAIPFPLATEAVVIRLDAAIPGVVEAGETLLYWLGNPDGAELVAFRQRELPARALLPVLRALSREGCSVTPYVEASALELEEPPPAESAAEHEQRLSRLDLLK